MVKGFPPSCHKEHPPREFPWGISIHIAQNCCKTVHVHNFLLIVIGWQGFIVNFGRKEPFSTCHRCGLLLFDVKIKLSSFSSFPSEITVCPKAQLVSSCCCMAACIVTKIFLLLCGTIHGPWCHRATLLLMQSPLVVALLIIALSFESENT